MPTGSPPAGRRGRRGARRRCGSWPTGSPPLPGSAAPAGCAAPPGRSRSPRAGSSRAPSRRRRRGGPGWRPSPRAAVVVKQGATSVMSLRWVPPANGSLSTIWSPGPTGRRRRRWPPAPRPASSPGAPGCARPGPAAPRPAVNSAAEQSARSLMLGEYAARRSTAPISSATPVRREMRTCRGRPGRALGTPSRRGPAADQCRRRQPVGRRG